MKNRLNWAVMESEELFLRNLPLIERMASALAARYHMCFSDREDFASIVKVKLISDDYAILRTYRHQCALPTFLFIVIQRCYFDYQNEHFGRWRPSAEAVRLGETAVEMERLVKRDGWSASEAAERILSATPHLKPEQVMVLQAKLSLKWRTRKMVTEALRSDPVSVPTAEDRIRGDELHLLASRLHEALEATLMSASPTDRTLLRLRFFEGLRPGAIATSTGQPVGRIYKRLELLLHRLRRALILAGIDHRHVASIIENREIPINVSWDAGGIHDSGPSNNRPAPLRRRADENG